MTIEDAIYALANAINRLADVHTSPPCHAPAVTVETLTPAQLDKIADSPEFIISLDDLGQPTMFKNHCSICGELGRNSRTCQPTPDGSGSFHWKVTVE